jgi:eukaryotic-like serine/threonine-protein kinase
MEPERLQKIDQVFQSALDLAPQRRPRFLDEACASDPDLRREVESLLDAHEQAGDFIEDSAADVATQFLADKQMLVPPGRMVGHYRVEILLGAGGMGEVYLATDQWGRKVALKLLTRRRNRDESIVVRFQQEAQTLLALNHPNIVTIYDIGQTEAVHYIASELVEGETLRQRLEKSDIDLQEVLEIAIQIATALAAAHEKGIVHRDIKPENVMIRRDGYVKVLDFGIAK